MTIRFRAGVAVCAALAFVSSLTAAAGHGRIQSGPAGHTTAPTVAAHIGLERNNRLVATQALHLANGHTRTRKRQIYNDVPIYGYGVVVKRGPRGNLLDVDGVVAHHLSRNLVDARPRLTPPQARLALQRSLNQASNRVRNVKPELFVQSGGDRTARLIYRVSYLTGSGHNISRPTAIIDANTGEIIRQWNGLTTGRRPRGGGTPTPLRAIGPGGNGVTGMYFYDGSGQGHEKLRVTRTGNTCYMLNRDVATYNLSGGQRAVLASFGCYGNNPAHWVSSGDAINGAFSPVNDAHHFGQVVRDMYSSWFGLPPLKNPDGSPMQLHMWVHYGTNYNNAFWDGSKMVFGDGGSTLFPFVTLGITTHEISHGFTEQHSGLEYHGQSGAINEAFSDMAGQAAVYYNTGSNDFRVRNDLFKINATDPNANKALRYMCDPSKDGMSIDSANDYYDGLNVHYASGVYNKAFCLLAKTDGWNTRKAFEVFHDANALYWGPMETFDSGACGVEQAAEDRSYGRADVTAAFAKVDVSCSG